MADWTNVGAPADIAPGKVKVVEAGGMRLAICHVAGGEDGCEPGFYAIEDVCTHDGGELDQGELVGCEIECPRHGARFDVRTGKVLCFPAVLPVPSFPVRVQDGQLQVAVGVPAGEEGKR